MNARIQQRSRPLNRLDSEHISAYRQQGFLWVPEVFNRDEVQRMQDAAEQLALMGSSESADFFKGSCFFNMQRDGNPFDAHVQSSDPVKGLVRRITYPYLQSPVLDQMRWHPVLKGLAEQLMGGEVVQIVNQLNFNHPGRSSGWGWHQDYRFRRSGIANIGWNFVQSLTALDPCHQRTGGLRLIPNSHLMGALQLDRFPKQASQYFGESAALTPVLEPGDVLFFGPFVVHGSTANLSQAPRRVYINGYARRDAMAVGSEHGQPQGDLQRPMEYEQQRQKLPAASKY